MNYLYKNRPSLRDDVLANYPPAAALSFSENNQRIIDSAFKGFEDGIVISKHEPIIFPERDDSVIDPEKITPVMQHGTQATIWRREWSDEYRITCRHFGSYSIPPENTGPRVTEKLSSKAGQKITDACLYCASQGKPFKTFLTLTFDDQARARIEAGETTMQKETSRFFDSLQHAYKRKHGEKLRYIWVAEAPNNEKGRNPHLHVLLSWAVPFEQFREWAKWLEESIWQQGFAHLERIHGGGEAASAYMAKAANYLSKEDQGKIRGNRYGISSDARAPHWEPVKSFAWHIMGKLIEAARFSQKAKTRKPALLRDSLMRKRDAIKDKEEKKGSITTAIKKARAEIEKIRDGFKYTRNCIVMQGAEKLNTWMWYAREAGWQAIARPLSAFVGRRFESFINNFNKYFLPAEFYNQVAPFHEGEAELDQHFERCSVWD